MKIQYWPDKAPDSSKPYCVVNPDGGIMGWFASEGDANRVASKYTYGENVVLSHLTPVRTFAEGDWVDGDKKWVQMYPFDTWDHPFYGTTTIDQEVATRLKESFDNKVKDPKVFIDYEHGLDRAKGSKAAGELLEVDVRNDGLWGFVQFTDAAKSEIDAGEWNYFSTAHFDQWTNPKTGETANYVLDGGGLTNKPFVKGMTPLNFSEIMIEDPKQFAVWSTAYVNNLPDSAFFYISSGGKKDKEGKTEPRNLRHLPYKDSNGNIDLPHLRNAMARANQVAGAPVQTILAKGKRLLGAKNYAEILTIEAEMAPEEYQEPGTGIVDPNINHDDGADTGSRIDTPPGGEDGTVPNRSDTIENNGKEDAVMDEAMEKAIRESLSIGDDVDIVEHITALNDELEPLRALKKEHAERKQFSEQYPEEAAELKRLRDVAQDNIVKQFSDALATRRLNKVMGETENDDGTKTPVIESTTVGLSGLAIEELSGVVRKFSEGTATTEDFTKAVDSIFENGLVDYGTHGSTTEAPNTTVEVPKKYSEVLKLFNEKVLEIAENDKLEFDAALNVAVQKYPELAEVWNAGPAAFAK